MFSEDHPRLFALLWIVTVMAIVAVIGGIAYALFLDARRDDRAKQENYETCMTHGGAWWSGYCVFDQNGALPDRQDASSAGDAP